MSLVLDTSMALSWFFVDERTEAGRLVLDRVASEGAFVPSRWRLEIANALQMSLRRKRITLPFRDEALMRLDALPISVDPETNAMAFGATLALSDRFGLTLYDAAYLELAFRARLPLATLDKELVDAGRQLEVEVLGQTI